MMAEDQGKTMTEMLKELMSKVVAIEQKVQEGANSSANSSGGQKRPHNGNSKNDAMPGSSHDGIDDQESEKSDLDPDDELETTEGDGLSFWLSEEGEAFMEATFGTKLEYTTRKVKVAKYSKPDSVWLKCRSCPQLWPLHCRRKW